MLWVLPCTLQALALLFGAAVAIAPEHHNALERIRLRSARDYSQRHRVQLTVNITEFSGRDAWVDVSWSGVQHPSFDDWIAVLAPADASIKHSTPVKYKLASTSFTHFEHGRGSARFLLENHRTDMRIAFFLNGFDNPHLVAKTPTIKCLDPDTPLHGRVTLTADPSEAVVQWTTAASKGGTVRWGTAPGKYAHSAEARDVTYTRDDMCGGAAKNEGWLDPGIFHYALLMGLEPDTTYYYVFGSTATGWSAEFAMRSAPRVGPHSEARIIALADMGQAELDGSDEQSEMRPSANTTRLMLRDAAAGEYSLVAHFGDISYARGHVSQWDRFHTQMEPLVTKVPYMVAPGNHERDWPGSGDGFPPEARVTDSEGECGVPYDRRFLMPTPAQDQPWYHFEHGPVHFVVYSTEHKFHKGSPQHRYIEAALASVDRRRTPWLVFAGHRPMYIDSINDAAVTGDQAVARELRRAFEGLLRKYGVDLTLHGHHHSYQRTCPIFENECQGYGSDGVAHAPLHLVIGNAGAGLCLDVHKSLPTGFELLHLWWGYTRIHATGTDFKLEAVSDLDGEVFDTVHLSKPRGWGERWHSETQQPNATQVRGKWWWEHDTIDAPPQVELLRARALAALPRRAAVNPHAVQQLQDAS